MAKEVLPIGSFDICMSNRCNLQCRYCYNETLNSGERMSLSFDQIRRALDVYLGVVPLNGVDKISLAGGEPLLDYPTLLKTVRHIRRRCGARTEIELFTNAILLSPERMRELTDSGAKIVVSIDGCKASNDCQRRWRGSPSGRGPAPSVFDRVMANLAGLTPAELRGLCASMTVTPETAQDLARNVRTLRDRGFGEVQINMDIMRAWGVRDVARLKTGIAGLKEYYTRLVRGGIGSFQGFRFGLEYILLKWDETVRESRAFKEISLGPDGAFYPCGIVSTFGPEKVRYRIGDLRRGLDVGRMVSMRRRAVRRILALDRGCGLLEFVPNPMMLYFAVVLKDLDARRMFAGTREVFRAFYDELGPFLRMERLFDVLSSDADFGDFAHDPPIRVERPVERLRAALPPVRGAGRERRACPCSKGWVGFRGLAEIRAGIDLLLYSPGKEKELDLRSDSVDDDFEMIGALALYALLKAARLGKALTISVSCPPQAVSQDNREFLGMHGIALVPVLGGSGDARALRRMPRRGRTCAPARTGRKENDRGLAAAVVTLSPGALAQVPGLVRAAAAAGYARIELEPAARRGWDAAALRALKGTLTRVSSAMRRSLDGASPFVLEGVRRAYRARRRGAAACALGGMLCVDWQGRFSAGPSRRPAGDWKSGVREAYRRCAAEAGAECPACLDRTTPAPTGPAAAVQALDRHWARELRSALEACAASPCSRRDAELMFQSGGEPSRLFAGLA